MTCYSPLKAYQSLRCKSNGKTTIVFNIPKDGHLYQPILLPCGQCIGCRLERSRQWAVRCVHEASLYDCGNHNCFVTLTFDDEHLPKNNSLDVKIFQDFMKRLREKFRYGFNVVIDGKDVWVVNDKIRFFHCGEYGEKSGRPHYHALLFNCDFPDKYLWLKRNGNDLFRSDVLEELWPFGFASIGRVTFESAAYVARYILKKVTGECADEHYTRLFYDEGTGEITKKFTLKPEYTTMSRRPGIGHGWYEDFKKDVYPSDEVVLRDGKRFRPPKYYDSLYEFHSPEDFLALKAARKERAKDKKIVANNTSERLAVRERVQQARLEFLKRTLE